MRLKYFTPYIWLSAFLCALFLVNEWQLELFGAAVIIVFIWAIISLTSTHMWHIPRAGVLGMMLAFWGLAFLSVLGSDVTNVSVMAFCFFSVMPLSFLVWSVVGRDEDWVRTMKILVFIYAGLAVWALVQFFLLGGYFEGRAVHPLNNPNSLAALFSLGFFMALGGVVACSLDKKARAQSVLMLVLALLLFGGIMAAGSRGALFALLPVVVIFGVVMRQAVAQNWRQFSVLGLGCLGLFVATHWGADDAQNLAGRMVETFSVAQSQLQLGVGDVTSNRLNLWAASWGIIQDHGLWGTGIGTYFLYFPEFRLSEDVFGAYYAHSDPLQYWVELGVMGPVLFYAFMIGVVIRTVRAFWATADTRQKLKIFVPFCALGACIIHTHVTFNLYNLSILFVVGFLLAVWFRATQEVLATRVMVVVFPKSFTSLSRAVAIAVPFLCLGALFGAYMLSEHYTNKARDHMLAGELEEFAEDVIFANTISLHNNYRSYLLAVNMPLTLLQERQAEMNDQQRADIFGQGLDYLNHIRAINPRSSSALYYMGKMRQLVPQEIVPDDMEMAQEYYAQALKIDPLHIGARLELADIFEAAGEKDGALQVLEEGSAYIYNSPKVMVLYGRLVGLYLQNGNTEKRQEILARMKVFAARMDAAEKADERKKNGPLWRAF